MSTVARPDILSTTDDGIATITLNRPDKLNAWTPEMGRLFRETMLAAGDDREVRAIVITGAGRGFCAGADMGNLAGAADGRYTLPPLLPEQSGGDFERLYTFLLGIPKPVVSAINGPAAGIGLVLALFSDFRFMAEGAKMSAVFARRGLIAEHGVAWMLPRLIGPMAALDLLMSGRSIEAAEAAELRLAYRLPAEDFLGAVRRRVSDIVGASSPRSIGVIKRQVHVSWRQSLAEAVIDAETEQHASLRSNDFREGVAHFLERREPRFTGR